MMPRTGGLLAVAVTCALFARSAAVTSQADILACANASVSDLDCLPVTVAGDPSNTTVVQRGDACGGDPSLDCPERASVYSRICNLGWQYLPCVLAQQGTGRLPFGVQRCSDTVCVDMCKLAAQEPAADIPLHTVQVCQHCPESLRDDPTHLQCQHDAFAKNATGCPHGWFKLANQSEPVGRCYFRSQMGRQESKLTWEQAHGQCTRLGGNMASMDVVNEWAQLVLSELVPQHHRVASAYWLDIQFTVRLAANGTIELDSFNGSNVSEQEVQVIQASTSSECVKDTSKPVLAVGKIQPGVVMCVAMVFQYHCAFWKATQCGDSRQLFCERESVPEPTEEPTMVISSSDAMTSSTASVEVSATFTSSSIPATPAMESTATSTAVPMTTASSFVSSQVVSFSYSSALSTASLSTASYPASSFAVSSTTVQSSPASTVMGYTSSMTTASSFVSSQVVSFSYSSALSTASLPTASYPTSSSAVSSTTVQSPPASTVMGYTSSAVLSPSSSASPTPSASRASLISSSTFSSSTPLSATTAGTATESPTEVVSWSTASTRGSATADLSSSAPLPSSESPTEVVSWSTASTHGSATAYLSSSALLPSSAYPADMSLSTVSPTSNTSSQVLPAAPSVTLPVGKPNVPASPTEVQPSASSTTPSGSPASRGQDTSAPKKVHLYPAGYPTDAYTNTTVVTTARGNASRNATTAPPTETSNRRLSRLNVVTIAVMSAVALLVLGAVALAVVIYLKTTRKVAKPPLALDDDIITNYSVVSGDTAMTEFSGSSSSAAAHNNSAIII